MSESTFNVTGEEYKFIDEFCKRMQISEGQGHKNTLAIFIDAYKKRKSGSVNQAIKMLELSKLIKVNDNIIMDNDYGVFKIIRIE